ncbi:hypothetical protein SLS54_002006 [Diplodia seriata]
MASSEQTGHAVYDPDNSGTKQEGSKWDISYGDGSGASGTVYADKVVVGGVTATSQAVEAATSVSTSFTQDVDNDGLLDLANFPLAYDFGGIIESRYTGDIAYVDVDTTNGFWEFQPSGFAVGDGETQTSLSIDAIADTGTTLLYLPEDVVSAYYEQVQDAEYSSNYGGYIFPCSADLPSFSLIIGDAKRTVSGDYINYAPAGSGTCFGGIQRDTGIGFSIIGDIFLKSQYVIFDASTATPRLGWAQQATSSSSSSNSTSGIF